jgi:hypothetical protein
MPWYKCLSAWAGSVIFDLLYFGSSLPGKLGDNLQFLNEDWTSIIPAFQTAASLCCNIQTGDFLVQFLG